MTDIRTSSHETETRTSRGRDRNCDQMSGGLRDFNSALLQCCCFAAVFENSYQCVLRGTSYDLQISPALQQCARRFPMGPNTSPRRHCP